MWPFRGIAACLAVLECGGIPAVQATPTVPPPTLASPNITPAPVSASLFFDATMPASSTLPAGEGGNFAPWEQWAGLSSPGVAIVAVPVEPSLHTVRAFAGTDRKSSVGLEIVNDSDTPAQTQLTIRMPFGLWSAQAALIEKGAGQTAPAPRLWRMESLFRADEGNTTKSLLIGPRQAIFLRWRETGVQAEAARKAVRDASARSDNRVMQDRIAASLEPVDDAIDLLPTLVEQSARDKIIKRVHTALLAAAKAQAVWTNWREADLDIHDAAFDALNETLSEISCAAYDLVPSQTVLSSGKIRVSVLNAGTKSVPLVALGLGGRENGRPKGDLTVFHGLAPGAKVSVDVAVPSGGSSEDLRGIVQFIVNMGAAVVPTRPAPPVAAGGTPESDSDTKN